MTGHYAKGSLLLLPAQTRRFLAGLSFVVGQHVSGVQPLGVVIEQGPLLVQTVGSQLVIVAVHHLPLLPAVVHWWSEIIGTVCECTMRAIFNAVTPAMMTVISQASTLSWLADLLSVSWTHIPVL